MLVSTKAIVLSAVKYGDSSLIVKCFTELSGVKSYLVKGVLSAKRGKIKPAYFQPLSQLEVVANHKNKGTLEYFKEVKMSYHYQNMHIDMGKNTMSLFLAEVLSHTIKEEEPNLDLFAYLENAFQWMDLHSQIANFHLYLLIQLTRFLGFFPGEYLNDARYFDLQEGVFTSIPLSEAFLVIEDFSEFPMLLGINFDAIETIKITRKQRQLLLKSILHYYELHLDDFKRPKSLEV